MNRIGFIGVGELALYTIRGVRAGGYLESIRLSPRNQQKAALLAAEFNCQVEADNQSVVDNSDIVVIATRPDDCLDTLRQLRFHGNQLLLSVVAGVDRESLATAINADIEIIRAMPVSSAEVGASPTLVYPPHPAVLDFFNHCGNSVPVESEDWFNQGSVLACVYCWFFALFDHLIQSTGEPRMPADISAKLVMGMAQGAAELALARHPESPAEIAAGIATEGTYSKLGLDWLQREAAFAPWQEACALLQKKLADSD